MLLAHREIEGYEVGGATRRLVSETGLHLATLWPADGIPIVDPDTPDGALRAALARGGAWSRDEAVERAIALAESIAGGPPAGSSEAE